MKVQPVMRNDVTIGYLITSPLSGDTYCFYTEEAGEKCHWTFNGDLDKPTFRPSMLNKTTGEHFFVTNGLIHYLGSGCGDLVMPMNDME